MRVMRPMSRDLAEAAVSPAQRAPSRADRQSHERRDHTPCVSCGTSRFRTRAWSWTRTGIRARASARPRGPAGRGWCEGVDGKPGDGGKPSGRPVARGEEWVEEIGPIKIYPVN